MNHVVIIISICLLINLAIWGFDILYHFNIWQKRIHIGRWNNFEDWYKAISKCAEKWLKRTPIVTKSDNNRLILFDILNKNFASSTIQSWQIAGIIIGTKSNIVDIPNSKNVDIASTAFAILNNASTTMALKPMMDDVYNLIINIKGTNDTIPYRKDANHIRFVDTIGLVCPFLVKYGITYKCDEAIDLAEKQIRQYSSFINPLTKTPPHAFNLYHNVPMGVFDWGRGIGWYILGIVECYRILENSPFKDFLQQEILTLSESLLKYQLQSGGFASAVFNTEMHSESSATILFGLLFIECYHITHKQKFYDATSKIISQLMRITQRNGAIDMCQGDTKGIGNYSSKYAYMPFAQGFAIVLADRYKNAHT